MHKSKQLEALPSGGGQDHISASNSVNTESIIDGEAGTSMEITRSLDVHKLLPTITTRSTEDSTDMQAEDMLNQMPDESTAGELVPLEVHTDFNSVQVSTSMLK